MTQGNRQTRAVLARQLGCEQLIQPGLSVFTAHFVTAKASDIQKTTGLTHRLMLFTNVLKGIRAVQRWGFFKTLWPEHQRDLETPAVAKDSACVLMGTVRWGPLKLTTRRQLLIRIAHNKATAVELTRRLLDVFAVALEIAVTSNIHGPSICLGLTVNHPFSQGFANTAAL